uniref:NADH-ubiquinone oxidoreductase chain 1 n=1 Tax=Mutilla europaea TaxID=2749339 RepID=A0A7L7S3C0_9HYME|nr:NADH dehydrogenase subunit 1 [Mutilla europaea]
MVMFYFIQILSVLISVAFITLLERKILGFIQARVGPNKILIKGLFQSLGDALKLASKDSGKLGIISLFEYNIMPIGMMFILLMLWSVMPSFLGGLSVDLLMILCIFSVGVYPIMIGGWFSGSFYSMLGSIRSIAQMISYEVNMIMIIISMVVLVKTFSLVDFNGMVLGVVQICNMYISLMLFLSFLIELNRTPIDLVEGESELVSGFNTEYYGFKFAMIFLSEYGMIVFMGSLLGLMVIGLVVGSTYWCFFTLMMIYLVIWIRGVLPRIRYDKLMELCWISGLSISVGILMLMLGYVSYLEMS